MPASHPVAGYQSKSEAVMALSAQGLGPTEIAKRLGISQSSASALRCKLAKAEPAGGQMIKIPHRTLQAYRAAASARGIGAADLVRRLLALVAADGLIEAILDDGGDGA